MQAAGGSCFSRVAACCSNKNISAGVFGRHLLKSCPNVRMLIKSRDYQPDRLTIARLRCKQWTCEFCAERNMNSWRRHLIKRFQDDFKETSWCFMTLTAPPYLHGQPEKSVESFQRVWKRLYDLLRRLVGEKLSYVYMYEAHKSGTYHMHALVSCGGFYDRSPVIYVWKNPLDHHPLQRWLKDTLASLSGAFIADVRRIYSRHGLSDSVSAVLYSIKYFAKAKSWVRFKKHARRIGVSQDIGGLPKTPKGEFTWKPMPWLRIEEWYSEGVTYDLSIRREITRADFQNGFYPPNDGREE